MKCVALYLEAGLADGGIAGTLTLAYTLDHNAAQVGLQPLIGLPPLYGLGRGTGTKGVRGITGSIGGEQAAPLHHHAQTTEAEHLHVHRAVLHHMLDLAHGEYPRHHHAANAEILVEEADGLVVGGRSLH